MMRPLLPFLLLSLSCLFGAGIPACPSAAATSLVGSPSCRSCHEKFYQLWSTSRHGLAMRPFTRAFAVSELAPQTEDIIVGGRRYRADIERGTVRETSGASETLLPIAHALGGKHVFYFLTPQDKGRLQTLPVAFDVRTRQWFDTAASGVRHAVDQPVDWRDPAYTFNTSCHGCHVSQLSTNYDPATDGYRTTWAEPGINCETCHGPAAEHNEVCEKARNGPPPADLKITRGGRGFTTEQNNDACSTCHAKLEPITAGFSPGEAFFDHFDLTTLEDPDYYPDGRDLGENYTLTSWRMSPCVASGKLDCLHCHTSSGRFRQQGDPNQACAPCHADKVADSAPHSRHAAGGGGPTCVACHMPMTEFARMRRSDHSMRPPTPAATMRFGSPNACNGCHADRTAEWADRQVRAWRSRDYQAPVLHAGELIEAARRRDFGRLAEMAEAVTGHGRDEIVAASLLRLLNGCEEEAKWPAALRAASDPSPLVRAAAVEALAGLPTKEGLNALLAAASDDSRLVRIRAAASLAGFTHLLARTPATPARMQALAKATDELLASYGSRPDQWHAHYNLGNFHLARGEPDKALAAYDTALGLEPRAAIVHVNAAMAHAATGQNDKVEQSLAKALALEPANAAVHFNLGLLKAEQGDPTSAEAHLHAALDNDPTLHRAAYNLCVLKGQTDPAGALSLCRRAFELRPDPQYAQAMAYFQAVLDATSTAPGTGAGRNEQGRP